MAAPKQIIGRKVSILLCVYNGASTIGNAIKSVQAQDYQNWELILIDDGSTDTTEKVCLKFSRIDPRIRFVRLSSNLGLTKALNKAINYAEGEYIARIDHDDLCLQSKLTKQVHFLEQNPYICLVGCQAFEVHLSGGGTNERLMRVPITDEELPNFTKIPLSTLLF